MEKRDPETLEPSTLWPEWDWKTQKGEFGFLMEPNMGKG
jgi:hypothetical protein